MATSRSRRRMRQLTVVAAVLLAAVTSGCTTVSMVDANQREAALAALEQGDRVNVLTPSGWNDDLRVVAVGAEALELEGPGDERLTVNRADIRELQVPVASRGKRAGLIAGIVAGVVVGLHLAAGWEFDF